ncbi:hypothetical protein [Nitrosomonas sp.]|uniref:hypothetical protein n=1 Tax=Nitrosomonas sp. TaxID=42353 RepID=UPI0025D85835|nr:hypothetical protein [Nitrosomonas sp.]MCC6915726.1 hypothetical protein [Nitrosomonas sp.]
MLSEKNSTQIHIDLGDELTDTAALLHIPSKDVKIWGPRLRFSARTDEIEDFYSEIMPYLRPFILYGSGDFHHLSALWIRRIQEPFVLLSFDNHPDWDTKPPKWCCGGWINRALESGWLESAQVWGCGNFELNWPHNLFSPGRALQSGRLQIFSWRERYPNLSVCQDGRISRETWRSIFLQQLSRWHGQSIYVTIDLDCLDAREFFSNWEHGLFTVDDLCWAVTQIRRYARLIGGDICGAYSDPEFSRITQRLVSTLDHPKITIPSVPAAMQNNYRAICRLWPLLAGTDEHEPGNDQQDAVP